MVKEKLIEFGKRLKKLLTIDNPNKLLKLNLIVIGVVLLGLVVSGVYRESHAAGDLDPGELCSMDYFEEGKLKYRLSEKDRHAFELTCTTATNYAICVNHDKKAIPDKGTFRLQNLTANSYWMGKSTLAKEGVSLATTYGYANYSKAAIIASNFGGLSVDWQDTYWATQILSWEYLGGMLSGSHSATPSSSIEHSSLAGCDSGYTCNATEAYSRIRSNVIEHMKNPSFGTNGTGGITTPNVLVHSYANKNWSSTLTDTNSASSLGKRLIVQSSGEISVADLGKASNGYQYRFSTTAKTNRANITFTKDTENVGSQDQTPLIFDNPNDSSTQELYVGSQPFNVYFSTSVRTENPGYLKATKTADDISKQNDKISDSVFKDVKFQVTGNGLNAGDLVLTVNDSGQLLYSSGSDEVDKENTKGSATITIYPGTYTLTEIDVPDRYRRAVSKTFTITEDNTTNLTTPKTPVAGEIPSTTEMDTNYMHNYIKMGYVAIQKYYRNTGGEDIGNSHPLSPEPDAEFRVYAKDYADLGWTYERIPTLWKDIITTNADGYARTKPLPYGSYYVEQTKGQETQFKNDKFSMSITEHEKTYKYTLFNEDVHGQLKIIKVDSETGKVVPYANTSFKILNMATNKYVTMSDAKPTPSQIDTFTTDSSGTVTLPGHLTYGTYKIVETKAPNGYYKNPDGVTFSVDASTLEQFNGVNSYKNPIVVNFPDKPQKANINITKTAEDITLGKDKKPEIKVIPLKYAEFEIKAAEDIITPDGTIRVKKGETVSLVKTNASGKVSVKNLYLGKYEIYEKAVYDRHKVFNYTEEDIENIVSSYKDLLIYDRLGNKENSSEETQAVDSPLDEPNNANQTNLGKTIAEEEKILEEIEDIATEFKKIFENKIYVTDEGAIFTEDDTNIIDDFMIQAIEDYNSKLTSDKYEYQFVPITTNYNFNPTKPIETITLSYAGQDVEVFDVNKSYLNKVKKGKLELTKTDVSDGKVIPGAGMRIYTDSGKIVCEGKTDNNGKLICNNLPVGKYYFQEFDAPAGYKLDTRKFAFEVKKDGEVKKAKMTNEMDYTSVPITDSDKTFIVYVIASLFIIIGSAISIGIIKKEELLSLVNKIKNKFTRV